jgi:ribosomal protein L21
MYALFEYKGKQYKAEKGLEIMVDKINNDDDKVVIEKVLLLSNEGNVKVGTPYLSGCQIIAKKGNDIRDKKVLVYKEKSKKNYHKLKGHRQEYTSILIEDIVEA